MSDTLDAVLAANRAAMATHDPDLAKIPSRHVAVVTCMDARVDAPRAFGLQPGEVHVIRNAGALVTDDVERSLLLSQYALETTTVLVVAHTDCGVLGHDEDATAARVEREQGRAPTMPLGTMDDLASAVRAGVDRLRAAPLRHRDAIHGFIFDVATGQLEPVT